MAVPGTVGVRVDERGRVSRRAFIGALGGAAAFAGFAPFGTLAAAGEQLRRNRKSCLVLWMAGGPSQWESLDPKPDSPYQGPTKTIPTRVPGVHIAEHWTHLAKVMPQLSVLRSMTGKEGNHGRATYLLHTAYPPSGGVLHPGFGAHVAQELGSADSDLPLSVAISGPGQSSSFLGVRYSPFVVTDPTRPPDNLTVPTSPARLERRLGLLSELEKPALETGAAGLVQEHQTLYKQTARMALSAATAAFDLAREPDKIRDRYGRSAYGQGCLMARRLIEAGVPFVEVQSGGWDTHSNELTGLKKLIPPVDQGTAVLVTELKERGLLENTLVIWMGEFGRTPRVNLNAGRDHYPEAWSLALGGCGVPGGRVVGATDKAGVEIADRPTTVPDLFCTFCKALGLDARKEKDSNVGRPLAIVERGRPVNELF
jgi:uncharacterized protein (DUF1501 family)